VTFPHAPDIAELKQRRFLAVSSLGSRTEKCLTAADDDSDDGESEISAFLEEIAPLNRASQSRPDIGLSDSDAEEHQRRLADRLDEVRQRYENILSLREEDSWKATTRLAEVIGKQEREELEHQEKLHPHQECLDMMDPGHRDKLRAFRRRAATGKAASRPRRRALKQWFWGAGKRSSTDRGNVKS
jgi:hypothetical protein